MKSSDHSASTKGFQNASSYDQHRPSYPAEAVDSLLKRLQVGGLKGARIVDLAAGTGKFTELLAARDEGYEILAVEPHDEMRGELERKTLKGVQVLGGRADSMPEVESQSVDAAIAAQTPKTGIPLAIPLFATTESLKEIHRILSPGGIFGMIWNIEDYNAPKSYTPTTEWEGKLKDITWSFGNDNVRFRHEQWRQVFENQLESTPFSIQCADPLFSLPLGEESVQWTHFLSKEAIWERYHTLSQFAVLEGKGLSEIKTKVFHAMSGSDIARNKDGNLALHGTTFSAWTTAIPGAPLKNGG